ncbi:nitroreductase family protein [Enterococcus hirae]|nr:nitroreductase family protein [Enterococcus hirae]
MNVIEAIEARRSCRTFAEKQLSKETIKELLRLGTLAPSGSHMEPWGFVVIQDPEEIEKLGQEAKNYALHHLAEYPHLQQYEKSYANPKTDIFFGAPTLILAYGDTNSHFWAIDPSLALENITLAALEMGIGSCFVSNSEPFCATQELKDRYHVPSEYAFVTSLIMGYMERPAAHPAKRREAKIFNEGI